MDRPPLPYAFAVISSTTAPASTLKSLSFLKCGSRHITSYLKFSIFKFLACPIGSSQWGSNCLVSNLYILFTQLYKTRYQHLKKSTPVPANPMAMLPPSFKIQLWCNGALTASCTFRAKLPPLSFSVILYMHIVNTFLIHLINILQEAVWPGAFLKAQDF